MKRIFITLSIIMAAVSCTNSNPFFSEWDTPYGIPDFGKIQEKHYIPAIEEGIRQQEAEIAAIIANTDAPTFENVVEAYDQSGALLGRVTSVLFNVSESDATESLQAIVEEALPLISVHSDNIMMNPDFFAKVDVLFQNIDNLGLNQEQKMVLKKLHNGFVKNGIALNAEDQERMREINLELSSLSNTFGNYLLAENNAFAEEFGVTISEYPVAMAAEQDRAVREKMFKAYSSRGNNGNEYDNKEMMVKMMALRIEKANLLGYENPAQMILNDKMAGNPETVDTFLAGIIAPAVEKAKAEIVDMQAIMDQDIAAGLLPEGSKIEAWDWAYYTEKVRVAKYALDEEQTKPYFQMENVRQGVFDLTTKLWGLQYEKLENIPTYHADVEGFKVMDADGSLIGVILTDYFPRSTKRGGAWMNNFVNQEIVGGVEVRPVIVNVGNFAKPVDGKPSLLTLDQVETLFHEYGHALHGLLSQCTYKSVAGTSVARDFVELPSQIMENWALEEELLKTYAVHYRNNNVIGKNIIDKIRRSAQFNQGFMTTELLAAALVDLDIHSLTKYKELDVDAFEYNALYEKRGMISEIEPRYRLTYFAHIFAGGYSSGYYFYTWAEVLDKDAFAAFVETGDIFNRRTAQAFRTLLSSGGKKEGMTLYREFRGAEPSREPLLKARGLWVEPEPSEEPNTENQETNNQ